MVTYLILLHGRGLLLLNQRGEKQKGGVYVWRTIVATDHNTAVAMATRDVTQDPLFLNEILNASLDELSFQAEEVRTKECEEDAGDSGFVFYIDEEATLTKPPEGPDY